MRTIIYFILIINFCLLLFQGCESREELPTEKLARLYVDILIAEQTYMYDSDSLQIVLDEVYSRHGITKIEYQNEISKFESDEERWDRFFESAKNYLDSLKSKGRPPRT